MKLRLLALSVGLAGIAGVAHADTTVFNNTPNGTYYNGTNANLNEEGEWFQTSKTGSFTLSGFDLDFDTTGTGTEVFSDLQIEVQVYGTGQSSYTDVGNQFGSLLSTQTIDLGAQSLAAGYYWDAAQLKNGTSEIALSNITTSDTSGRVGVVFSLLNAGSAAVGVQTALGIGTAPSVGSNAEADYNLTFGEVGGVGANLLQSQYLYSGTVPTNMAVQLYASSTPEPASMAVLGLGIVGLIARRRRSSK